MPGRVGVADLGDLGVAGEQPVDQGAGGVAGAGMHDQARRLVDDDEVVVGVDDRDLDVGLRHQGLGRRVEIDVDLDHVALDQAGRAARGDRAVAADQARHRATRRPGCGWRR